MTVEFNLAHLWDRGPAIVFQLNHSTTFKDGAHDDPNEKVG